MLESYHNSFTNFGTDLCRRGNHRQGDCICPSEQMRFPYNHRSIRLTIGYEAGKMPVYLPTGQ
jgi:hypothetical protein